MDKIEFTGWQIAFALADTLTPYQKLTWPLFSEKHIKNEDILPDDVIKRKR